jgi:hypothetical protein
MQRGTLSLDGAPKEFRQTIIAQSNELWIIELTYAADHAACSQIADRIQQSIAVGPMISDEG